MNCDVCHSLVFQSGYTVVDDMTIEPCCVVVKDEPMLFSADIDCAYRFGGELAKQFIRLLPDGWEKCIIDSRVHMLMPGWYPCIPGWHLDDVPRTRVDQQPDHVDPVYKSEHIMAIIGDASRTEYLSGTISLEDVPVGGAAVYRVWNEVLQRRLAANPKRYERHLVEPGKLYQFDWQSFHRGSPATGNGWRWFIRASRNTTRPFANEIRRQVQIYMPAIDAGW